MSTISQHLTATLSEQDAVGLLRVLLRRCLADGGDPDRLETAVDILYASLTASGRKDARAFFRRLFNCPPAASRVLDSLDSLQRPHFGSEVFSPTVLHNTSKSTLAATCRVLSLESAHPPGLRDVLLAALDEGLSAAAN